MGRYTGKRIVPRHAGVWDRTRVYEPLEIVLEEGTGDSYISRKDVPAGTALSQDEYWAMCQRFNEQVQLFREAVDQDVEDMKKLTDDTVDDIRRSLSETESTVDQRAKLAEDALAEGRRALDETAAALNTRMDGILTGSTGNGDVEVADIRTDSSGKHYTTAGEAVRDMTAGLPEKWEIMDSNAIRNGEGNTSAVEMRGRVAHFTFAFTGTGYVGCFLRIGDYAEVRGRKLRVAYRSFGQNVNGNITVSNSRSAWGSTNGSVISKSQGTLKLDAENGYYWELELDFNAADLSALIEEKRDNSFYLIFRAENTRVAQAADFYIYVYESDGYGDLFWKYNSGSEHIHQIMEEVEAARTDTIGVTYKSIGERMSMVDSLIVPSLLISSVTAPRDNTNGLLTSGNGGFSGVNNRFSAAYVFDYSEYTALESPAWSTLHCSLCIPKQSMQEQGVRESLKLKVRVEGLGENKHIGETQRLSYYVNAVGSWSRVVNPMRNVDIKVGTDNTLSITREEVEKILNDSSANFYIVFVMSCFNTTLIADMGRIRLTAYVSDGRHTSVAGFTTYADAAGSAVTAEIAGDAAKAEEAGHSLTADYTGTAGFAFMADNFFISSPEDLLNQGRVRYSPGLDTTDIPTEPVVLMRSGFQTVVEGKAEKTENGVQQKYELTMKLGRDTSQIRNQGYQKNLGAALTMQTILEGFTNGYRDLFICSVEDCENFPPQSQTGSYTQRLLLAIRDSENKRTDFANNSPVATRALSGGKKIYLWKVSVDAAVARGAAADLASGAKTSYWNGIWHTRYCEEETPVVWKVFWYWLDYAYTDGSFTNSDMLDFFINKYVYWGSNVNHLRLERKFRELDEVKAAADALQNEAHTLREDIDNLSGWVKDPSDIHITCWGDSLTAGGGWTTTLARLSGATVHNGGTGGENARVIMARQGGDVMTINNITIPAACEPVTIAERERDGGILTEEGYKVAPLLQGGAHVNPVMIGDIEGTLKWTGSNYADRTGIWTFTRSTPGEQVRITRPTAIRTAFDRERNGQNEVMIIYMGQNAGWDNSIDKLVEMHRKMIDHFQGKEYVILGLSSGSADQRAEYETTMKKAFGRRFISLREYLAAPVYDSSGNIVSCYGLEDQGLTPGETVYNGVAYNALAEIATGTVPHQILTDAVHYTAGTKTVIGKMLYRKMVELNILK